MTNPIRPAAAQSGPADVNAFFAGLRDLLNACGPKTGTYDKIIVAIVACIDGGLNTRPRILGAVNRIGFGRERVAKVLDADGADRWRKNADGTYSVIGETLA